MLSGMSLDVGDLSRSMATTTNMMIGSSNCTDLVANNPEAFSNAYWEFGSFEVYKPS